MGQCSKARKRFDFRTFIAIAVTTIVCIGMLAVWQTNEPASGRSIYSRANLPPMNLTLVGLNGTELTLNEVDIGNLASYESYGGYKNILGNIRGLGNYTGIPLVTLCNLVGGITVNDSLRIAAADNYTTSLSYPQVNGDFVTYDNITGQQVAHNQSLTSVLAYYFNETDMPADEGPLRLAIIGPEGLATFSGYWVKQVVRLEIRLRDQVTITSVEPLKTAVGQNYRCRVNVTVANQGFYNDTLSITVYANQTTIGTNTTTLSAGDSITLTFIWNTTGFVLGNYSMSARLDGDPPFADGSVRLSVGGDTNGDGVVDIYDAIILSGAFGSTPKSLKWNPNADINDDQNVDIFDAIILAGNFGKTG